MSFLNLCIACLATEEKMYSMNKSSVITYSNLTGITCVDESDNICYKCMGILLKIERFQLNCLRAYKILTSSEHSLDHIVRKHEPNLQLTQPLIISFGPDHIDISDTDDDVDVKPDDLDGDLDEKKNNLEKVYCTKSHIDNDDCAKVQACDVETEIHEKKINLSDFKIEEGDDDKLHDIKPSNANLGKDNLKEKKKNLQKERKLGTSVNKCKSKRADKKPLPVSQRKRKQNTSCRKKKNKYNFRAFKIDKANMATVLLSPEDARKEVELRKETNNYIHNKFQCTLCFRGFKVEKTFTNHMEKHDAEYGEFECDYCHVRAKSRHRIKCHINICHIQKFSCKVCRYVCFSRSQAISHIRLHEGRKYECKYCKKIFLQPNTLSVHMRQAHITQQNEIVCELCGDVFISKAGLNGHKKIVHWQESNSAAGPACSECDVHFSSHTAYRRHLVLSKKHTVSHGCTECGATFPDDHALRLHHESHRPRAARRRARRAARDPAPYASLWRKLPARCPECPVMITARNQYKKHMITAHPDSRAAKIFGQPAQYVCELCGLGFKLHCYLRYHMSEHTGERPYACAECEQRFCDPGALQRHRASHKPNPNPKVPCDLCDKTFTVANLKRHRRTVHLGIRPHKCEMCERAFHDYCHLKLHIRHTHGKVPWPIPNRKTKRTPKKKNVNSTKISRECDESEAGSDSESS